MIIAPMQSLRLQSTPNRWLTRLVTLFLAALAAASLGYWVLKWPTPPATQRVAAPDAPTVPVDAAKVARLLGAGPGTTTTAAASPSVLMAAKYKLLGVMAQGAHNGSALIGVDGKPAKPFRVGEAVADGLLLQSVKARSVALGPDKTGAASVTLELPPLPGVR